MKLAIQITGIKYVNEIKNYWSDEDYKELLTLFNFPDVDQVKPKDLREMLNMAITDFEPEEAAQILLTYKLSDQLNEGQIQSISYEMMQDKIAEEYPEPELHFDLFNINQLLFKAYNGTFPNTEASIIEIELPQNKENAKVEMTEEIMTKFVSGCLTEKSLLKRLYADQIEGKIPFKDAGNFIWSLNKTSENKYELLTSRYWIDKGDISHTEYEGSITFYED
jgi:hypothetical protein